jgi:hypothetical protein
MITNILKAGLIILLQMVFPNPHTSEVITINFGWKA